MSAISDSALLAQIQAGIRVNGNREITPPIHKSIEDNIVDSKLSIVDGGNVIQSLTGYTTELTLSDRKHFVYKGWLDDALTNLDLSAYLKHDGSVAATGNFNWGGFGISNFSSLSGASTISIISPNIQIGDVSVGTINILSTLPGGQIYNEADDIQSFFNNQWGVTSNSGTDFNIHDTLGTTFTDGTNTGGIRYNADYSANYTNRSLVDKAYVLSRTGLADTGVLTYGGASASSATQINIGAVTGQIVDNETTPGTPIYTSVSYAGASNVTVTTIGSGLASYVLLDSTGTIVFQNTFPTSAQRKTHIYLSKIGHPSGSITTVGNEPDFILSPLGQLRSLTKHIGFINDSVVPSANGANLNFNISTGTVFRHNGNFVLDDTIPNEITVAAQTPASFLYRTQTGAGGGFVTAIDPTTYDNAGTSTAIPGSSNQATNQRIFLVPGLGLIIQPGQTIYSTLSDAIAALQRESFIIYPSLSNNAILIGVLSVTKGCTALNNTSVANFFPADKFGQVGGSTAGISTSTLQSAYNNSLVPQITVTDTLGAQTLRNGRASNNSSVFEIQNIAASTTASINGNGLITGTAFIANGTAGAGYLQLVSQSVPPTAVNGSMILYTDSSTRFSMVRRNNANSTDITRTLIFNDVSVTYTFPSQNTDTLAGLGTAQTFTAQQTFTGSATQMASVSLLDTTYKTGLDVAAATSVRVGNGFTSIRLQPSTGNQMTWSGSTLQFLTSGGSIVNTTIQAGSLTFSNSNFIISAGLSGATNAILINSTGSVTVSSTSVASIYAYTGTINATSTGTISLFNADPTITAHGGDLYGYRSNLASGTNRWNIYSAGTAPNRFIGNIEAGTIQILDTTYKTALDISAAGTVRLANGFTVLTTPITAFQFSGNATLLSFNAGGNLSIYSQGGAIANSGINIGRTTNITATSGTNRILPFQVNFAPTSGNNVLSVLDFTQMIINQTGTATSTSACIDVNPVMTSYRGTFYGIKSSLASSPTGGGTTWNIYADGTASNYFAGNTGIGTTTTTASFLTIGAATTANAAMNFISGTAPSTPNDGDFWFDGTNVKIRVAGVTKTFTLT